ncbi:MAG: aldo/keto reductase [Bacteroidetes bacterium]|nr:MAG: aldo/keto reductase [Bacteroidota bacterium]
MKRRNFIKATAVASPMISYFPASLANMVRDKEPGKLEKRMLGRTGENLSIIGFGGIVVKDATSAQSSARVSEAINYGVNYFDVAPTYGNAEIMLGPALEPYRKDVFLACKTTEREKEGSQKELDQSLKRLRTDHFDLYQLHAVNTLEDVDTIFSKGGAMETFLVAKKEGKVRHIGFSSHTVEAAMVLLDRFDFDTILFPINFATWYAGNFGPQVLAKAHEKKMGILALKSMVKGPWPKGAKRNVPKVWYEPLDEPDEMTMGMRFTLSHPVTAAIPPGNEDLFKMALGLATKFKPLSSSEVEDVKEKGLAGTPLFRYPKA